MHGMISRQCDSFILKGIRIGKHAIVGAGSVITHDVNDHSERTYENP